MKRMNWIIRKENEVALQRALKEDQQIASGSMKLLPH